VYIVALSHSIALCDLCWFFRTALMHYVDIVALPRTHILKELAKYAEDPAERDKLLLMADTSAEG
jgi:hypothetical protein